MDENGSVFRVAYYEAGDRRLARAGATLSRRMENGHGMWRLELPRLGGERLQLGSPATRAPPERIAGAITAFLRGATGPVVRLQVARDDGELRARSSKVCRPASSARRTARPRQRGLASPRQAILARPDLAAAGRVGTAVRTGAAPRPGIRLDLDAEDVHRVRVAVRRARAVLRAARPLLDTEWSEPLRAELKWLGGVLGPRRDLDVLIERLRKEIVDFETPNARRRAADRATPGERPGAGRGG